MSACSLHPDRASAGARRLADGTLLRECPECVGQRLLFLDRMLNPRVDEDATKPLPEPVRFTSMPGGLFGVTMACSTTAMFYDQNPLTVRVSRRR